MLPSDPLNNILPLIVEETNISLNMSLLIDQRMLLRLFSPDRKEDDISLELSRVLACDVSSLSFSGLGLNLRMMDKKSDLSDQNYCPSLLLASLFCILWLFWGRVTRCDQEVQFRRVSLMNLCPFFERMDDWGTCMPFSGQQYGKQ